MGEDLLEEEQLHKLRRDRAALGESIISVMPCRSGTSALGRRRMRFRTAELSRPAKRSGRRTVRADLLRSGDRTGCPTNPPETGLDWPDTIEQQTAQQWRWAIPPNSTTLAAWSKESNRAPSSRARQIPQGGP